VSDKVNKKEYKDALALIDDAMSSLLHLEPGSHWDPKQELLVTHEKLAHGFIDDEQIFQLLGLWQQVAEALDDPSTASALRIQCAIDTKWLDWDVALAAFREAKPICAALFDQWQAVVARESVGVEGDDGDMHCAWVRHLILAANGDIDAQTLAGRLRAWIKHIEAVPKGFQTYNKSLVTLLLDVGQEELPKRYPKLKAILEQWRWGHDELKGERRRWLKRFGGREVLPDLLDLFARHIADQVPDPGSVGGSNYDGCAAWMGAVRELAPEKYSAILRGWQGTHKRRRNLWKAMSAQELPV